MGINIKKNTATEFDTDTTVYNCCAFLDGNHLVVAYNDSGDSGKGKVICASISGRTLTFGTAQTFTSAADGAKNISICALDETHFAVVYTDNDTNPFGEVICGSVSGTTITLGSSVTFETTATSYTSMATLDATHFIIAHRSAGIVGKCTACSVSGTAITAGSSSIFWTGNTSYTDVCALSSTHFVISFTDVDKIVGSDYVQGAVICGSVSGTTITITQDGGTIFDTGYVTGTSITSIDSSHFVISFEQGNPTTEGKVIAGSVSGRTITITEDGGSVFDTGDVDNLDISSTIQKGFVISFRDIDDSYHGKVIAGKTSGNTITIVADSGTAFSDTATVGHLGGGSIGSKFAVVFYISGSGLAIIGTISTVPIMTLE